MTLDLFVLWKTLSCNQWGPTKIVASKHFFVSSPLSLLFCLSLSLHPATQLLLALLCLPLSLCSHHFLFLFLPPIPVLSLFFYICPRKASFPWQTTRVSQQSSHPLHHSWRLTWSSTRNENRIFLPLPSPPPFGSSPGVAAGSSCQDRKSVICTCIDNTFLFKGEFKDLCAFFVYIYFYKPKDSLKCAETSVSGKCAADLDTDR